MSRWQLGTDAISLDPLDPYYGEPASYSLAAPERGALQLHPSRVVRFFGNPLADPALKGKDPEPAEQPEPPGAAQGDPHKPAEPTSGPKPSEPLPPADQTPSAVLRGFTGPKSMRKWQNQMIERGWTAPQIEEAIQNGQRYPAENRVNPGNVATRYVHQETGRSVVIDDTTRRVIQLGGDRFDHD